MNKTLKDGGSECEENTRYDYCNQIVLGEKTMNIVSTYTPQVGLREEIRTKFFRRFRWFGTRNT